MLRTARSNLVFEVLDQDKLPRPKVQAERVSIKKENKREVPLTQLQKIKIKDTGSMMAWPTLKPQKWRSLIKKDRRRDKGLEIAGGHSPKGRFQHRENQKQLLLLACIIDQPECPLLLTIKLTITKISIKLEATKSIFQKQTDLEAPLIRVYLRIRKNSNWAGRVRATRTYPR